MAENKMAGYLKDDNGNIFEIKDVQARNDIAGIKNTVNNITGDTETKITEHDTSSVAHNDIRTTLDRLSTRINTILNSEDIDLDQLAEIVAYIKSNRTLIDSVTTSKVNVADIVDNLLSSRYDVPLSANQGRMLKDELDSLRNALSGYATTEELSQLSEEIANLQTSGLTTAQVNALDGMFNVCAFVKDDVSAEYTAFKTAFGIGESGGGEEEPDTPVEPDEPTTPTLTSISASYTGGDVAVGTAVNSLTGIAVTAHYSDGSTANVTGYTLSGTIAEGSNTITVSYGGLTTTFTVTGVVESGGETTGVSNETTWTDGVAYTFEAIEGEYPDKSNGAIKAYSGWWRSPYLYCEGASAIRGVVKAQNEFTASRDNAFYDADKNYVAPIETFAFTSLSNQEVGAYVDIPIPENAAYFIVSASNTIWHVARLTDGTIRFEPDIEYVPVGDNE